MTYTVLPCAGVFRQGQGLLDYTPTYVCGQTRLDALNFAVTARLPWVGVPLRVVGMGLGGWSVASAVC